MKLVEILAKALSEWPESAVCITQDDSSHLYGWIEMRPECRGGAWYSPDGKDFGMHDPGEQEEIALASDQKKSIVTKAQWQAERDRQKGGEWKRHRGGDKPKSVSDGEMVEVRLRCGDTKTAYSDKFLWSHSDCDESVHITKYRVISQPQAEEVEVANEQILKPAINALEEMAAEWQQSSGPLAWRDTIIHCQAIIEDCEREIQRNVDLLDAEGLMMQTDSKKAMQHYAPDVEQKDWQIGDILEITRKDGDNSHDFKIGEHVKIDDFDLDDEDLPVKCNALDDSDYWYIKFNEAKFMRRP